MRVLVCGGRSYFNRPLIFAKLDGLQAELWPTGGIELVIHGGATGVDSLAAAWASIRHVPAQAFPADWEAWGRSAGMRRNGQMLKEGRPGLVLAFPGGKGTAGMVQLAQLAAVTVRQVKELD
jgi:hypothetical protein